MTREIPVLVEGRASRRKEIVNIVANFLVLNREEELLDEWTMTEEASARLAELLERHDH